jgi:hypothetical protein
MATLPMMVPELMSVLLNVLVILIASPLAPQIVPALLIVTAPGALPRLLSSTVIARWSL